MIIRKKRHFSLNIWTFHCHNILLIPINVTLFTEYFLQHRQVAESRSKRTVLKLNISIWLKILVDYCYITKFWCSHQLAITTSDPQKFLKLPWCVVSKIVWVHNRSPTKLMKKAGRTWKYVNWRSHSSWLFNAKVACSKPMAHQLLVHCKVAKFTLTFHTVWLCLHFTVRTTAKW